MTAIRLLLCAAAITAAGCATPTLVPAPDANRLARHAAIAETGGVRLVARAESWSGVPLDLPDEVTPLLVTVMNESERPIRVAHQDFALISADGGRYRALAPHRIQGVVTEAIDAQPFDATPFWPHPPYWNPLGPMLRYIRLPTVDMLRQALPEGVLKPSAELSGFVYFERLPPDPRRVELRARFRDAEGERMTRLAIPFQVS